MCGICGFYSTQFKFSEDKLSSMTASLAHRGPDAQGIFSDGLCGLGHRRLSILDLSEAANQPMFSHNERYAIVFNGEIYNYRELAKQIDATLRTTSDTEVLVELFARKYLKFAYQLNGMFAMAIYDKQDGILYLLRDRLGIKPLYYYWNPDSTSEVNFAFASELKALMKLSDIPTELNYSAVQNFLHLGYVPAPDAIFKHVYKLRPGFWMIVSKEGIREESYWQFQHKIYDRDTQEKLSLLNKESEAKKQLKKLLQSSVEYRLISDVPVGILLSGGIDSSTIAALAVESSSSKINTFSIGFKESAFNESDFAKTVAQQLHTDHTEFMVSVKDAQELIPQLLNFYDEPFADSSCIPTYLVSQLARQHVKVALGGDGGDELFLGYGMYQWADRLSHGFWQNLRYPIALTLGPFKKPSFQKAKHLFRYSNSKDLASHIFSQEQLLFSRRELKQLMISPAKENPFLAPNYPRNLNPMEKQALFDLQYYLPDDLLVKVDRASMQHGLEVRVPLLDHRVVEFAVNLNPALRYKGKTRKYLLKQVLYDYLPEKLFARPKQGFSIPLADWLSGDLSFLIDRYLDKNLIERYGLVNADSVELMKKKFLKGQKFYYNRLWALIVLHQFMEKTY
ncbi:MAG: asparagine synthase (glutamine-hydrolyzing) [Microscillaceae bacterium]|nr:asparagine synthase (glutamine-hydrolyzing) [Microscillaceae bacterium]